MNKYQTVVVAVVASILTLTMVIGLMALFDQAIAAPAIEPPTSASPQTTTENFQYISVSALAFEPVQQNVTYTKNLQRQILSLTSQNQTTGTKANIFVAPLTLPDQGELLGLTLFGEDFDPQGEVRLRLKRCDHSQARCVVLADTTSTAPFAAGQFETLKANIPNEIVDNRFYTYYLELEITAVFNSGLRSVRLDVMTRNGTSPQEGKWALEGELTRFPLPNSTFTQVRICTDDLSHLNNRTHYPFVVADERVIPLASNSCVTVRGREIEIRRELNTGPSSGTYEILR